MKTKSLFLSLILFAGLIGFNACQKDDGAPDPLNQEDANIALAESDDQFVAVTSEIQENSGYNVQGFIDELYLPFNDGPIKTNVKGRYENKELKGIAQKFFNNSKTRDLNFNFYFIQHVLDLSDVSSYYGTWNYTNQQFVKASSEPTNQIVLNFPYNSETNNVKLTYYDIKVQNFGEGYVEVVGLKGKIEVDNVSVFTFSVSTKYTTTEWTQTITTSFGNFDYTYVNYVAFNNDYFIYKYIGTLKKMDKIVYKESSKFKVTNDNSVTIEATLTIGKLEFRMKLQSIDGGFDNFYQAPNDYLTMSLYTTGDAKIGSFIYVLDDSQEWNLFFEYTDGTQVSLESLALSMEYRFWGYFEWLLWGDFDK